MLHCFALYCHNVVVVNRRNSDTVETKNRRVRVIIVESFIKKGLCIISHTGKPISAIMRKKSIM